MGITLTAATGLPPVTLRVVDSVTLPDVAMIIVEPATLPEKANPAPLIVATSADDELQVTDVVRFCVVLSEYVPVAVNCCVVPVGMLIFAGVTLMDTSFGAVTARVTALDEIFPSAAVIVVVPVDDEVTKPLTPAVLLIVATEVFDELQVTDAVRSCV
jgi:hypothetical protein